MSRICATRPVDSWMFCNDLRVVYTTQVGYLYTRAPSCQILIAACPVVWMFTSKSSFSKLEDIQKRALRFVLDDYTSDYHELLNRADIPRLKIMTLRYLAIEVYKCVNGLNPKVSPTSHGLKSLKNYGAKIWNLLPESCKGTISLCEFKDLIKSWNGPKCSCSVCLHFTWIRP